MKIRKSKITSLEYSATLGPEEVIHILREYFLKELALKEQNGVDNFDPSDVIISMDDDVQVSISYRRDQGSRPEAKP